MISATFSLVQQLTRLHAMPSVKIVHTDDVIAGQVYSPVINVMIMIGTVALSGSLVSLVVADEPNDDCAAVGFGTNTNLTNAYGCAVA
jgi:KUP system potassium uptake protein